MPSNFSCSFVFCRLFSEILSGILSESNSLDPDQARHFVLSVCNGYQRTIKAGIELNSINAAEVSYAGALCNIVISKAICNISYFQKQYEFMHIAYKLL